MRVLALGSALFLLACSGDGVEGAGTDGATDTDADTDSGSSTTGAPESCDGVDCGGKGMCTMTDDGPVCLCNDGTFDDVAPLDCSDGSGSGSNSGGTSSSGGSTSGASATSGGTSGGSTGGGSTSGGSTSGSTSGSSSGGSETTGGSKGDGEPCAANDECQSGYCYAAPMGFPGPTPPDPECQSMCIGGFDFSSICDDDDDCCMGTCEMGFNGPYCMQ